jgi:hypothetical protein
LTRIRAVLLFAVAALAALALAACGGDDGGDEDPREVLEATFNNDQEVTSGVVDLSLDLSAEGDEGGEVSVTFAGPFQDGENGAFSQFDMEAEVSIESDQGNFSGSGALISTGDRAFVNFQGTDYEIPRGPFQEFARTFAQLQEQNQADPAAQTESTSQLVDSFTDLSNEGTEDVEGTETTHVSAELDVEKFADTVRAQVEEQSGTAGVRQGQLAQLNALLDQLGTAIKNASLDVYSGTEDDILRKAEFNVELENPQGGGETASMDLSLTLSGVNEQQEIAGPAEAQPLNDLLSQFGIDPSQLQQLGAVLGGASGAAPQTGGEAAAPTSEATQAYLECLQTADSSDALQECASLLGR